MQHLILFLAVLLVFPAAWAAPPVCNAAAEGTLIYNKDHKIIQFCNGTQWIGMVAKIGGPDDTLGNMACNDGETPRYESGAWVCAALGSGGGVKGLSVQGASNNISSASASDIIFNTAPSRNDFASGSWTTNRLFTVPSGESGWYNVSGYASMGEGAGTKLAVYIVHNGNSVAINRDDNPNIANQYVSASHNLYLQEGDTIRLRANHQLSGSKPLQNAALSIVRLGGGSD